jgi:hypothetical protein
MGGGAPRPVVVYFYSLEDERENRTLDTTVFCDEGVALSLRMFRCVKIDVETIDDRALRKQYRETPGFLIVDPHAQVMDRIAGKSAVSVSRMKGFVGKSWNKLFTMRQRDYLKGMKKVLDELDKLSGKKTVLNAKKARLASRPNPSKARALQKEEEELAKWEARIQKDEEDIKKKCTLKKEWLEDPAEAD